MLSGLYVCVYTLDLGSIFNTKWNLNMLQSFSDMAWIQIWIANPEFSGDFSALPEGKNLCFLRHCFYSDKFCQLNHNSYYYHSLMKGRGKGIVINNVKSIHLI